VFHSVLTALGCDTGKHPCLADTATFGVLRAVKGMDTFTDVMKNTNIAPWYERMQALVGEGCQVK
jgi:microsomal prostaglandin-E synthase 2